jgi:HlyD family secretion protein
MSDMLQANQDQPEVEAIISIPIQDEVEVDDDVIRFEPLFEDDEEDNIPVASQGRRRRVWLLVLSVALLLVLIGGGALIYMRRADASQVQYSTNTVAFGNLTQTVSASGPLQAKAEYDMNFNTSGQVSAIDVHVGQQVKAGQVLAKLNAPNLQIAVEQAQITVDNAQQTYDTAVSNGDAQTTLNTDNNSLQSAELQLQTAQNDLAAATLTAPANATVATINGMVGQIASSSSSSAFMVLIDTSGYNITASVNEADVAKVQINQPVRFTLTAYPSQVFRASVSSISMVGTTSSGVVTYPVNMVVDMSNIGNAHLYPGMTATVNITTAQRIGALLVSNNALTFTTTALQAGVISRSTITQFAGNIALRGNGGQATSNRHVVLVLRNGQLMPVLVTVGLSNGVFSEVISGLNQGDQVVVGATGGAFANLSTGTNTTGGSLFRTGGGGGGFGGGSRTGSGG